MAEEQLNKSKWGERMINISISIVLILIASWVTGFADFRNKAATKEYVKEQIEPIKRDVESLEQADTQIRLEFLEQIKMLRTDLNLKQNKQ